MVFILAKKIRQHKLTVALMFAAILTILILIYDKDTLSDRNAQIVLPENVSSFTKAEEVQEEIFAKEKLAGSDEKTTEPEGEIFRSENFRIRDVRFGGAIAAASGNDEAVPLEITEVKGNTVSAENKKDNKVLITWKTNKLAVSTLEYTSSDAAVAVKFTETDFGFSHGIVLSGLEPGKRYIYSIKSKDRWGNEQVSDKYAVYISNPTGSILDVIAKELDNIFGWAMKK